MQILIALAMAVSASSGTVTYKCRDAAGNWTAAACRVAVPMPETAYMREQRERETVLRKRREERNRLAMYCFRLDTKASFYDCVDAQMLAYDVINRMAREFGPISPNSARLAGCLTSNQDSRTEATDYRRAMECFFTR